MCIGSYFGIENFYLHNNYIELLVCVGVVDFVAYYGIYVVMLVTFVTKMDFRYGAYDIAFLLMLVRLVMDVGAVTYETKLTYREQLSNAFLLIKRK